MGTHSRDGGGDNANSGSGGGGAASGGWCGGRGSPLWHPWQVLVNLIHIPLHRDSFPRPLAKLPLLCPSPPLLSPHRCFHITPAVRRGEEGQGQLSGALNREVSVPDFTALNLSLLPGSPPPTPFPWPQTNPEPPEHSSTLVLIHSDGATRECGHNPPATTTRSQAQPDRRRGSSLVFFFFFPSGNRKLGLHGLCGEVGTAFWSFWSLQELC